MFKSFLNKTSFVELQRLTQSQTSDVFQEATIDWLFNWASGDYETKVTKASLATLAFLSFPETMKGVRERIFQKTTLVHRIIQLLCENGLSVVPHIEFDELTIQEKLGAGSGGEVFSAQYNGKPVAVKFFKKQGLWFGEEKEFFYESTIISLFSQFDHFLDCFGVNIEQGFIVMQKAEKGSLSDVLQNQGMKDWEFGEKIRILTQISEAVNTLHKFGIMHRDLKPANLLLDKDDNCYLVDFGVSRSPSKGHRKRSMTMNVGTSMYMAPEVLEGNGIYSEQIDVFSFAMVSWQVLSDCGTPYLDQGISLRQIPAFVTSGSRLEIPFCPAKVAKLLNKCWHQKSKKRPSFQQILAVLYSL